jgi:hypothetical protein
MTSSFNRAGHRTVDEEENRMTRALALLIAVLMLIAGPSTASAWQATPAAEPGLSAGTPVTVVGPDGAELGRITLEEWNPLFTEYEPNSPPQHGFHFVLANLTVENTGPRPLPFNPRQFSLLDADGFLVSPASVNRGQDAAIPDLANQEIAPGASVNGIVAFQALNGVPVTSLLYTPSSDRAVTIAAVDGLPAPAVGETVGVLGSEGAEVSRITITSFTNPFEAYDPNYAPARGSNYVGVEVSVVNSGPRPLRFDARNIALLDADGFLYMAGTVRRPGNATPPDFQFQEALAVGAEAGGFIGFEVLGGVQLARVVYVPSSDRLVTLVDLTATSAG